MIGKTISHYRIVEKLGEGGMGVVYVAEDTLLGRRVAIKMLTSARGPVNQHFRMRFLREAQAVSKLSHPHIANIYDYGETENGEPYIVMELVEGPTLADLIKSETLTIPRTLEIIKQVAEALEEAHRRGIIHRDIKPSNIALNERGNVKVLDFGLAKHVVRTESIPSDGSEVHAPARTQTREGLILGTPMYLSPEQALGVAVDARSDLFSLGSVLYECIAGRPAFPGNSDIEICAKVIRDDPPPPSQFNPVIPAELDQLTMKALAKKPEARYQTANELVGGLTAARTKASGLDQRVTRTSKTAPRTRSTSALAILSGIFKRPRLSVGIVILSVIALTSLAVGYALLSPPTLYQPPADAQRWYEIGADYLREGAYFKAIKPFQQAINIDNQFLLARARLAETWTELDYSDKAKDELLRIDDPAIARSYLSSLDTIRLQGIRNTIKRDFAKAAENYRNIAAMVASQDVPSQDKAYAYLDLGRAYIKNQERDQAIQSFQEAVKLDSQYAAAFLQLGLTYGRSQKFDDAYAAFDQASKLFDISGNHEGVAEVWLQRSVLLIQQRNINEAREQLFQAQRKSAALQITDTQIKALLNLSFTYVLEADSNEARRYSTQALELAKANGLENLTTGSLNEIGFTYLIKGKYSDAESYFNEALRWAQLYKGERNEARALLSLASSRSQQDDPDAVLNFVGRALPFYERGGYGTEILQGYSLKGRALNQIGEYDAARQAFELQLQTAQKVNNKSQIAYAHEGLGLLLTDLQQFSEALTHFEQQQKTLELLDNRLSSGYAAMNRANALWQLGRYDEAITHFNRVTEGTRLVLKNPDTIVVTHKPGAEMNSELLGWTNLFIARMALSRGDFKTAIASSQKALHLIGSYLKPVEVRANYTLGLAYVHSGRAKLGYQYCKWAVENARLMRDARPLPDALLALAEAALYSDDAQGAFKNAREARQEFLRSKQNESEWRALVIQARASRLVGDESGYARFVSEAEAILPVLERQWGKDYYATYLSRPDVLELKKALARTGP